VANEVGTLLSALAGVTGPERKRKVIGREFIRVFEQAAQEITAGAGITARRAS
jgi:GMP synthase (glutamine-hydrolysing)